MIYHRPDCPDYNKVSEQNRALFRTEVEAAAAGYRKARNCP
jgi:deoxyribonuclease-1